MSFFVGGGGLVNLNILILPSFRLIVHVAGTFLVTATRRSTTTSATRTGATPPWWRFSSPSSLSS